MKKFWTTLSIVFAATMIMGVLTSCEYASGRASQPQITYTWDIDEYEIVRSRLYDSALNLLLEIKDADNNDWEYIPKNYRDVIENYRVPSLEILLKAIDALDSRPMYELADAYDEPLVEFDAASREYEKFLK